METLSTAPFGHILRGHRVAAGFSQEHLAAQANLSVESIGALERGVRRAPYRETIAALARALALSDSERRNLADAAARGRARTRVAVAPSPGGDARLPAQFTSLVGREDDVEAISTLLATNRLVTITGCGGVGKTRAAVEVAVRAHGGQWDAIRFVDLSQSTNENSVRAEISSRMRNAGHALLVLDTCEHIVADVAVIVRELLSGSSDMTILATSRERLNLTGEQVYRLPSLDVPRDVHARIADARRHGAVDLFIQRATAFDQTIKFADADTFAVVNVVNLLDGIPLAIELAATRFATIGLAALGDRLRDGLELTGGPRDLPMRQRTMTSSLAWSYDLLNNSERVLLEHLSVLEGAFSLAVAESTCAGNGLQAISVLSLLSSLVEKSLLNVSYEHSAPRYVLPHTVRAFARSRHSNDGKSRSSVRRRLQRCYDVLTFATRDVFSPPADPPIVPDRYRLGRPKDRRWGVDAPAATMRARQHMRRDQGERT
jgi:predicted ATPase/DNA-binding XRE family transcriptional regulator